jgi:hypothetical protein
MADTSLASDPQHLVKVLVAHLGRDDFLWDVMAFSEISLDFLRPLTVVFEPSASMFPMTYTAISRTIGTNPVERMAATTMCRQWLALLLLHPRRLGSGYE